MNLLPHEYGAIMAIVAECHPTWPARPQGWYESVINVVARGRRGVIVGWTAYSIAPPPTMDWSQRLGSDALCAWLWDTCVTQEARGHGIADALMSDRLHRAEAAGCQMAFGACDPTNAPMVRLLEKHGFDLVARAANPYPDGTKGDVYIKRLF